MTTNCGAIMTTFFYLKGYLHYFGSSNDKRSDYEGGIPLTLRVRPLISLSMVEQF